MYIAVGLGVLVGSGTFFNLAGTISPVAALKQASFVCFLECIWFLFSSSVFSVTLLSKQNVCSGKVLFDFSNNGRGRL